MSQQNQISEKKIILPPWLKPNLGYERVSFSSTSSTFLKRIQSVPINQPVRLISGTSNTTPSSQNCREIIQKRVVMSVMEKRMTLPARIRHHDDLWDTRDLFYPCRPYSVSNVSKITCTTPPQTTTATNNRKKLQQQQQVQQSPTFTKNHHLLLDLDIKTTNLKSHVL